MARHSPSAPNQSPVPKKIKTEIDLQAQARPDMTEISETEFQSRFTPPRTPPESNTTLVEYLSGCHGYLHSALTYEKDSGTWPPNPRPEPPTHLRPISIMPWKDFGAKQAAVWDVIMSSDLASRREFDRLGCLERKGEEFRGDPIVQRSDLDRFVRDTVFRPAEHIINMMVEYEPMLRKVFGLQGEVTFKRKYLLRDPADADINNEEHGAANFNASQSQSSSARSGSQSGDDDRGHGHSDTLSVASVDRFFSHEVDEHQKTVLGFHYFAPSLLNLDHLLMGLQGTIEVDRVLCFYNEGDMEQRCQRLVTAVVTQAYSHMILSRMPYGCIITGNAFIFLHVPVDKPACVEYFLSVPRLQAGGDLASAPQQKPQQQQPQQQNKLHLTAVAQMTAFVLNAIREERYDFSWMAWAVDHLQPWPVDIEFHDTDVKRYQEQLQRQGVQPIAIKALDPAEENTKFLLSRDVISSEQRPVATTAGKELLKMAAAAAAAAGDKKGTLADRQRDLGPYCSMLCLKGLAEGGPIDPACPNLHLHRSDFSSGDVAKVKRLPRHPITHKLFQRAIRQILEHDLGQCEELPMNGSYGALYRLREPKHGYTVVGKGTRREWRHLLCHEGHVYRRRLRPIQGVHVPVHLGNFDLDHAGAPETMLYYLGTVPIVHMMVMSYAGESMLYRDGLEDGYDYDADVLLDPDADHARRGLEAIHALGVLHGDVAKRNLLNYRVQDRDAIVWHDFGEAKIHHHPRKRVRRPEEEEEEDQAHHNHQAKRRRQQQDRHVEVRLETGQLVLMSEDSSSEGETQTQAHGNANANGNAHGHGHGGVQGSLVSPADDSVSDADAEWFTRGCEKERQRLMELCGEDY